MKRRRGRPNSATPSAGHPKRWHCLVRMWRARRGWTLSQLGKETNVGVGTLSQIERGTDPQLSTAMKISAALHVEVDDLWQEV